METLQVTQIRKAEAIEALNRSEIDIQISTAKQYPRDIAMVTNKILAYATSSEDTAEGCFYSLSRSGKGGDSAITGPSVRLAEIVANCWGNLRVQSSVIANDGKFITARGICHDLESNTAVSSEVQRRITDRNGRTFSEDMQVVTGNAAGAIAFRNAVFKVVPMAIIGPVVEQIKNYAKGSLNLVETKQKMIKAFATAKVTEEMLASYLEIDSLDAITADMIMELRGLWTAIKEGTTTAEEAIIKPFNDKKRAKVATEKAVGAVNMVAQAMNRQNDAAMSDDFPA